MTGLIGKKIGMTQVFDKEGNVIPVTVLRVGPCVVIQKKSKEKDGYNALQLGFEEIKEKKVTKPLLGHFNKYKAKPHRVIKEFKCDDISSYNEGDLIKVDIFEGKSFVNVEGISKGKGFQGVMKRWGFGGGPKSHGAKQWHRRVGSIGASSWPSRVFKGTKMPGKKGNNKVTIKNLKIVEIQKEKNVLLLKGAVPGFNGNYVFIKSIKK